MYDFVNWNISCSALRKNKADAFFVSFPKSGRTWVRVFYNSYFANVANLDFSLHGNVIPGMPEVIFTHDRWEHRHLINWWHFVRGRHLIPTKARRTKKIILMVRDPRDVVVSLYFHLSKRPHVFRWKPEPISAMLRSRDFGIASVVELMNGWLQEWRGQERFKLMRYEDCRANDAREFRGLLEFLGVKQINERAFNDALIFCSFENMQKMEKTGSFREKELSAANPSDVESFKARRGKVGGFSEHFTPDDLAYAAVEMARLDPEFGYR
jgi:hypothetical protein